MQTRQSIVLGVMLLAAASALLAAERDRAAQALTYADGYFAASEAGKAVGSYQLFLHLYPNHPRADHALYMLGEACRLARSQMIVPAWYFTEFNPELHEYRRLAHHLAQTYGMYAGVSEGDSYWYYDMRAYRELPDRFPKSEYADDCRFLLVEPEQQRRAWAIGSGPAAAETARDLIREYEGVLTQFPDTNRRADIEAVILELREIEQRNAPTRHDQS
jgi:hypothetical protein